MSDENVKQELNRYASEILWPKSKGDVENLLATELALATYSADPMQKIRHILEAYMMLTENEKSVILPHVTDRDEALQLYVVALGLLNITPTHDGIQSDCAIIPFAFGPRQAYRYLGNFVHIVWNLSNYYTTFDATYVQHPMNCTDEQKRQYFALFKRYLSSGDASLGICLTVKTLFIKYVLPKTLHMLRTIYTQFISPEKWYDVTTSFRGTTHAMQRRENR
jgi:hypothetical protein